MLEEVRREIARYSLCRAGDRVGVAVSGGADSVALLTALVELRSALRVSLHVLHVNHQLRGADSDADQAFVQDLADRLGLLCSVHRTRLDEGNVEEQGRKARYAFFADMIRRRVVDVVATGHHRDDQAETVLFRLLRGTGVSGLAGVRRSLDGGVIRPLLGLSREELRAELEKRGVAWREDASNQERRFSRNRLRHETLPRLSEEWNPRLAETLARTAEVAAEDEDYWRREVARLEGSVLSLRDGWVEMDATAAAALHPALRRRLMRRAFAHVRGDLAGVDFGRLERADELLTRRSGSGAFEAAGLRFERSCDRVRILELEASESAGQADEVEMSAPAEADSPDGLTRVRLTLSPQPFEFGSYTNRYGFLLDADQLPEKVKLRSRRDGDRLGSSGKLKELFQRARVPSWERAGWPVLVAEADSADEDSIVWCRGFGVPPELAAGPQSRRVWQIQEVDQAGKKILRIEDWASRVYQT